MKNALLRFVKQMEVNYDVIVLELSKELLGSTANVFLVNTYLNPQNSSFYDTCDYDNGITMLEQCLLGIVEKNEDASFILCGDFNARTANKVPTYFDFASSCFDMTGRNFWLDGVKNNDPPFQRCSKDTHINVNGHDLLALCSSFDLYILNGTCERDTSGQYTYISTSDNSVIDYFIFSRSLCSLPHKMLVLEIIDSKHMLITCSVRCQKRLTYFKEVDVPMYKLKWSDDKRDIFLQNLYLAENLSEIDRAESLIVINVNEAISVLTAALNKVASCLVKKQSAKTVFLIEWYDKECKDMRRRTKKALRTFLRSRLSGDSVSYCEIRKKCTHLLLNKEKEHKLTCRKELESNICDPKQFWRNVKKFNAKKRQVGDISDEKWLQRFKKVFDVNSVEQGSDANTCSLHTLEINWNSCTEDDFLNSDISPKRSN